MLREPHILPLTTFVSEIRAAENRQNEIPFFDPLDGGIEAKFLFVLEAPGPQAVKSGFISRNNPDESAKNMFLLLKEAGFARGDTLLWNIVPWYIGDGTKIRGANRSDVTRGLVYLQKLLTLLEQLQCLILVGQKAASARVEIAKIWNRPIYETPHPSPKFVNRLPANRDLLLNKFCRIRLEVPLDNLHNSLRRISNTD
jgi:uracil-DNA glycosylase